MSDYDRSLAFAEQQRRFQRVFEDALSRGQSPSTVQATPEGMPKAFGLQQYEPGSEFYDEAKANAVLAQIRQFDPNASLTNTGPKYEGDGTTYWALNYDQSKLPQLANPQASRHVGSYGSDRLYDQSLTLDDPNYGPTTLPQNVKLRNDTWLNTVGPLVVAAIAGGAGLMAGGSTWGASAARALPRVGNMLTSGGSGQSLTPQQLALWRLMRARRGG